VSLLGVTSNGGVTPHPTSQNYTSRATMRQPARKPPRSGQKRRAGGFASVAKGKHRKILTGSWLPLVSNRDMLSCQPHLSESAMMAQHSDVGRRRRLQKPYQSLRACAYPWKLQDYTLDHLCLGSSAHRWWFAPSTGAASPTRMLGTQTTLEPRQPRQPG